jgi:hypothetical protein
VAPAARRKFTKFTTPMGEKNGPFRGGDLAPSADRKFRKFRTPREKKIPCWAKVAARRRGRSRSRFTGLSLTEAMPRRERRASPFMLCSMFDVKQIRSDLASFEGGFCCVALRRIRRGTEARQAGHVDWLADARRRINFGVIARVAVVPRYSDFA